MDVLMSFLMLAEFSDKVRIPRHVFGYVNYVNNCIV